jgi:hypothetical protein
MDRRPIDDPEFREMIRELAKQLRGPRKRLNLGDYYKLLEWVDAYTLVPAGTSFATNSTGFLLDGVRYLLLFTRENEAAAIADKSRAGYELVPARAVLRRVPEGSGMLVDWNTNAEARISADHVTELNERYRIWPIKQEATEEWLRSLDLEFTRDGIPRAQRAARAMTWWRDRNGFRVVASSRRARNIDHFFATHVEGDKAATGANCEARWRDEYATQPYLGHLDAAQLKKRLETIMTNLLFSDRGALPHEFAEREWLELFHHVRYEHERRQLLFADAISATEIMTAWPRMETARAAFARHAGPPGQLFRFSKREFLQPLLETGALKIFPAARYADASLLPAQRDDELARTILVDPRDFRVTHTDSSGIDHELQLAGTVRLTSSYSTNYYVWFTTTTFDPRLFDDFGSDACLIIHDSETFIDRLFAAFSRALPDWVGAGSLVRYFDPLRAHDEVLATFEKDFQYAYQREFRFAWDPPNGQPAKELPQLDLNLGPLTDVASLLSI